ncbi:MAG: family transcriptional regulator, cyclic receptor protein [Chloroflexota bacterium]|nr:family transcriptional regulator, cyclic receptor protein [Chloroflexota bacterium]
MDAAAVADFLAENPLFACLGPQDRLSLATKMRPRNFARDEVVFHRDDPAGQVFLIASGTVKVSVPDEQGHEVVVALERGGDVFGELALFDDGPRSATVTALTETHTLALARQEFITVLEGNPDAMRKMLALLVKTVRRSTGHVEDLVFLDLPGRVAKCLLDLAEAGGAEQVDLTQEDLASFVGATRVSVNRVLADLERRDAIKIGRRNIQLKDRALLQSEIRY